MPFTLAHPAAILPLRSRYLHTMPLILGAMTPDLPYYAPGNLARFVPETHEFEASYTVCLALGYLALLAIFVLRRPLTALMSPRARWLCLQRPRAAAPALDRVAVRRAGDRRRRVDPPAVGLLHPYRRLGGAPGLGIERAGAGGAVHRGGLPRAAVRQFRRRTAHHVHLVLAAAGSCPGASRSGGATFRGRSDPDAGGDRRGSHRRRAGDRALPPHAPRSTGP